MIEVINSGRLVPMAMMVTPITRSETPKFREIITAFSTRRSDPKYKPTIPPKKKRIAFHQGKFLTCSISSSTSGFFHYSFFFQPKEVNIKADKGKEHRNSLPAVYHSIHAHEIKNPSDNQGNQVFESNMSFGYFSWVEKAAQS